jgi:anti-sigma regulatory factor (Ser/Thr protein kinase)
MPDRASTIAQSARPAPLQPIPAAALAPSEPEVVAADHTWTFPGTSDQVRVARRALTTALGNSPAADEIVLCLSEMVTNAVRHSASAALGGTVRVRAEITGGAGVYLEVIDDGGPWQSSGSNDGHLHGLGIVRSLATSLAISGSETDGWTIAAWFGWNPQPA